jgi:hypothetical protein
MSNTTGTNAGYGNFTNLTANLPYGSNTILFSAGFKGTAYTEFWKYGLISTKMEFLKQMKKWYQDHLQ